MGDKIESKKNQIPALLTYRILAGASIFHALILTLIIRLNLDVVSGHTWIVLVWLWFLWPVVILIHPARSLRRWLLPVGVGILLLVPCWAEILAFTAWQIHGFAP